MAERRIWLVRHGETEWSKSGQHTGRTNIALTANGERQAKSLGKLLAGKKFALVLASPMARAQTTARLAGVNEFEVTEDLHEWNYGIYEGITTKSVREKQPNWTIWEPPIPEGEPVEHAAVLEREARAVPRTHDAVVAYLALGQRAAQMAAALPDRVHAAAALDQNDAQAVDLGAHGLPFAQLALAQRAREALGLLA